MSSEKMKNLVVRTVSGVVLFAVVLAALLVSKYTFLALILLIAVAAMWEFFNLAQKKGVNPPRIYTLALGVTLVVGMFLDSQAIYMLMIPALVMLFILELYRESQTPMQNISTALCSVIYAALPMGLLTFIASWHGEYDPRVVLAIIFTVWANDVFAFLVGSAIGRHKLFERISPKKSWEGFCGGVICAMGFSMLAGRYFGGDELVWAGLGLVVALSSVFGDLVESMFKREAGVKDSGNIIPGHGGVMDRFDALIIAIPFVFTYFILFNP